MKIIKKSLTITLALCLFIGIYANAADIYFSPIYSDVRFPPSDKLHASCNHSATISIESKWEDINTINLVLKYDPQKIKILNVLPQDKSKTTNYSIEYDKIIFNKISSQDFDNSNVSLFNLYFKSTEATTEHTFEFIEWSYVTTKYWRVIPLKKSFIIQFEKVPECEPDIVAPKIEMIKPINKTNWVELDSSFVFDIQDDWKWIDKDTLKLSINNLSYSPNDKEVSWSWNQFVVYPRMRLPINKNIPISISIADKQKYWWANTQTQTFEVKTATWVVLENYIDPSKIRELSQWYKNFRWTQRECGFISNIYIKESWINLILSKSILQKLGCPIPTEWQTIANIDNPTDTIVIEKIEKKSYISVFAVIWWVLFVITFLLKIHYRHWFSKHKKIVEQFKKLHLD